MENGRAIEREIFTVREKEKILWSSDGEDVFEELKNMKEGKWD